jgi:hypothetical protein
LLREAWPAGPVLFLLFPNSGMRDSKPRGTAKEIRDAGGVATSGCVYSDQCHRFISERRRDTNCVKYPASRNVARVV